MFLQEEREWVLYMMQPAAVAAAAANAGPTAFAQTLSTVVVLRFPSFTFCFVVAFSESVYSKIFILCIAHLWRMYQVYIKETCLKMRLLPLVGLK